MDSSKAGPDTTHSPPVRHTEMAQGKKQAEITEISLIIIISGGCPIISDPSNNINNLNMKVTSNPFLPLLIRTTQHPQTTRSWFYDLSLNYLFLKTTTCDLVVCLFLI